MIEFDSICAVCGHRRANHSALAACPRGTGSFVALEVLQRHKAQLVHIVQLLLVDNGAAKQSAIRKQAKEILEQVSKY